jgi:phosphoribosylformimino-5-aminoimidazole carboxamide ribotide isomerase
MILYPAIDLKDGMCVRLVRGDMSAVTVFSDSPSEQALRFENSGFEYLHLVDLNGAFQGRPINGDAVRAVIGAIKIPVQLGGGIRSLDTISFWLDQGVSRVILGTVALRDPSMVKTACGRFPGRIVVGIDSRAGRVAALDLALQFADAGVSAIVYTDIERDGALGGVNVEATADLAFALTTPVIASGGVASIADLQALKAVEATGIEGVICGRALYDGRLDPAAALALLKNGAAV